MQRLAFESSTNKEQQLKPPETDHRFELIRQYLDISQEISIDNLY